MGDSKAIPPAPDDITNDLVKLFNSSMLSDIQFDVNGVKFLAHKAILCVRSEYFRAMIHFEGNALQAQSPIKLKDVEPGVFPVVLHYVYTNRIRTQCSPHVLPVWRLADRFSMDGLKALSVLQLSTSLPIDNVIDIYLKVIHALPVSDNMKDVCELFMQNHMVEVVRHRTFMSLNKQLVAELTREMVSK
ncbi:ankyrin repeat and BTB/POZ domain-containing protein 1 [Mytilus galloprovincialis]|uniref:Ankyrin repeat and BTB/POZ domain-containing protein 1 n=1 Tax=Mytilus galloprovincialis TaxID=29158 RepID=A0A8B6FN26_MYTGA|nr:ankyrin repeat and BTB/POZ domain-containing protein 1 [Mytilus galloprovincialis]